VVLVLGLFLNAERSSAAVFFVGVLYLVMKTPQRARNRDPAGGAGTGVRRHAATDRQPCHHRPRHGAAQVALPHGTLADRFGGTSFDEVVDRIMYQVHGITSVLKHPVIGPTQREYAREVIGEGGVVFSECGGGGDPGAPQSLHQRWRPRRCAGLAGCCWPACGRCGRRSAGVRHTRCRTHPDLRIPWYLCFSVGVLAVMGNAVFHNAGIFTPELATSTMVGLLLALYRQVMRRTPRRPPEYQRPRKPS
jgi:hypothetical protein